MHCKAIGHIKNFEMHTLKQVYIHVVCVELYWLTLVQSLFLEFFKLFRKFLSNSKRRNSLNFPIQIQKFISKCRKNLSMVIKVKL